MISNCNLRTHIRDALDLPEDASNEALVDAVNALYADYREIKDELGVPYWADHKEVLDEVKNLASSRDRHQATVDSMNAVYDQYQDLKDELGVPRLAYHNEVLAHIRAERQALVRAGVLHVELCEALGLDPEASDQQVVDKVQNLKNLLRDVEKSRDFWRQKAEYVYEVVANDDDRQAIARASLLYTDLCEVLGLDPEGSGQRVAIEVVNLKNRLRDVEKSRDSWRQEVIHLQGIIDSAKEALED